MSRHQIGSIGVVSLMLTCSAFLLASAVHAAPATNPATQPTTRPAPGPLSNHVKKGLTWLAKHQLRDGSWGQGEESTEMGNGLEKIKDTPNVADTCMTLMALVHSGSTPVAGDYPANIVAAVNFICGQIEASDDKSLAITSLTGTRTQIKLGPNIDTFMAAQALAEMKGKMADATSNNRVDAALKKVLHKMEVNQKDNGQWAEGGWAPTLAQAQAAKGANMAVQHGAFFSDSVRMQAQQYARNDIRQQAQSIDGEGVAGGTFRYDAKLGGDFAVSGDAGPTTRSAPSALAGSTTATTHPAVAPVHAGRGFTSAGNAGVPLYSAAADIAAMQASANTNHQLRGALVAVAASPTTQAYIRAGAAAELRDMDANDKDLATAQGMVVTRMQDPQFANGFGSNGGEEYLSYLNIGESLFQRGGDDWTKWAKTMSDNLNRIQNDDGSWSGGHCITGRTFCTAAAIQVLVIDRSPTVIPPTTPTTQPTAK